MVAALLVSADGTSCGASMVKMSVDFPNEAARCQLFLSERAQSNFAPRRENGPVATAVTEVISAATGRPTCPIRNIQTEGAGPRIQAHQPAPGGALLSRAQSNRRSRPSSRHLASHHSNPSLAAHCCQHRK